jgi:hypothetical protein
MSDDSPRFALSPTARRLIRSYGLLIAIAIAFLLMAMMVREKPKTVPVESLRELDAEVLQWR